MHPSLSNHRSKVVQTQFSLAPSYDHALPSALHEQVTLHVCCPTRTCCVGTTWVAKLTGFHQRPVVTELERGTVPNQFVLFLCDHKVPPLCWNAENSQHFTACNKNTWWKVTPWGSGVAWRCFYSSPKDKSQGWGRSPQENGNALLSSRSFWG